ncbi:MAG: hypothetical protein DMG09_14200, partial [Acidobacteria bacterium]
MISSSVTMPHSFFPEGVATMIRRLAILGLLIAACSLISWGQRSKPEKQAPRSPDFRPTAEVPAMPKALMKFPRTHITRAKFPAIDFHFHGGGLKSAE